MHHLLTVDEVATLIPETKLISNSSTTAPPTAMSKWRSALSFELTITMRSIIRRHCPKVVQSDRA